MNLELIQRIRYTCEGRDMSPYCQRCALTSYLPWSRLREAAPGSVRAPATCRGLLPEGIGQVGPARVYWAGLVSQAAAVTVRDFAHCLV